MSQTKAFFEQKIVESSPGYVKGEQKPVGQREWSPTPLGSSGAHTTSGYNTQTTKKPSGVIFINLVSFSSHLQKKAYPICHRQQFTFIL